MNRSPPAPFGPSIAKTVSRDTPKLTSSTAFFGERSNVFDMCKTRRRSVLEFSTATVSSITSWVARPWLSLSADREGGRMNWSQRGSTDPESTYTKTPKRRKHSTTRYKMGPPNFVMLPSEDCVTAPLVHKRENKLIDTRAALIYPQVSNHKNKHRDGSIPHWQQVQSKTKWNLKEYMNFSTQQSCNGQQTDDGKEPLYLRILGVCDCH